MNKRNMKIISLGVLSLVLFSLVSYANLMGAQGQTTLSDKLHENTDIDYASMIPSELFTNSLSEGLTKIGELDVDFGNAYRASRQGNLLFIASLSGGVTFIDVTNQSNPIVKGNYWNGGEIYDAVYKNGYCYTANIQTGIEVLDYSDFDRIEKVGSYYDGTGQTKDLEFIGISTLYVADGSDGLEIFTLSPNGTIFTKVKSEKFGATDIISVKADPLNNIAFLMCGSAGIKVIDITRPTTPLLITTLKDGTTNSRNADLSARILYVADGANGMKVYNYTDKTNITLLDQFTIGSGEYCEFFTWDVAKRAYMTTGDYLYQLNTSDPRNITQIWRTSFTEGETKSILSVTSALYLCNDFDFKIIGFTDDEKLDTYIKSEITFAGEPSSIAIDGDIAVLVEGITGVDFINITDPTEPILISKLEKTSVSFWDVEIKGNYVYCATSQGLEVISIADIHNPVSVRTVTSGFSRYIALSGNYAYLSTSAKDFVVINIATPTSASEVTHLDLAALPRDIAIGGNYAYTAVGTSGVQIVDITTPSAPALETTISTSSAEGVAIFNDLLLVADSVDGVILYNVSNLGAIVLLDTTLTTGGYEPEKVAIENYDIAFVAVKEDGIIQLNITDPTNATKFAHFSDGGEDIRVRISNDLVFAADTIDSFEIIGKDTDLDRIADYVETNVWGTDPNLADTDADGILDGDELDYWLDRDEDPLDDWDNDGLANIIDPDSDNDTILDGVEVYVYGSDPIDLDSDNDQIPDEEEVIVGSDGYITDPADADTDDDDLTDGEEILGVYAPTNPGANATGYIEGLDPTNPDTDGDGPYDGWEVQYGYNPLVPDSSTDDDGDGLTTAEEFTYGTDPNNPDTDGDTLSDGDEVNIYGTSPLKVDTDGDYIPDNWEILWGLNPLDKSDGVLDPDNDGLNNYEEFFFDTEPDNNDTDGDGLPDGWEAYYGTGPKTPNGPSSDLDEDGLTDHEEYLLGTDPLDPDTDDDGFIDSIEVDEGTDPLDPNDYPIITPTTPPAGIGIFVMISLFGLAGLSLVSFRFIQKRK